MTTRLGSTARSALLRSYETVRSLWLLLLVFHLNLFARNTGDLFKSAVDDQVGQLGRVAEEAVRGALAREAAARLLAEIVGRSDRRFVLPASGQSGHQHHHHVLNPLRYFRHAALPVCQLQLVLSQHTR